MPIKLVYGQVDARIIDINVIILVENHVYQLEIKFCVRY